MKGLCATLLFAVLLLNGSAVTAQQKDAIAEKAKKIHFSSIVLDTHRTLLDACLYVLSSRNTTISRLMPVWACLLLDRFLITSYRKGDLTK